MGVQTIGKALSWEETIKYIDFVKEQGVLQFIELYLTGKSRRSDPFKFGDEIEYTLVFKDDANRRAKVSLRADQVLHQLQESNSGFLWQYEYANYMIEGVPGEPFSGIEQLTLVEENMRGRRKAAEALLKDGEHLLMLTSFPRCKEDFLCDGQQPGPISQSEIIGDEVISPHPRFRVITRNLRQRKCCNPQIYPPLFIDKNTNRSIGTRISSNLQQQQQHPDGTIFMDAMVFGMGNCCLQCTFQASNEAEARYMYDQLAVVCPILLALTAATPFARGLLTDTDVRWDMCCAAVDDRTPDEMKVQPKSRYSSISTFVSNNKDAIRCSDLQPLPINPKAYELLQEAGIDDQLSQHIAHLFTRDPLIMFEFDKPMEHQEDEHIIHQRTLMNPTYFENIQSTNWNSMRLKPPEHGDGWRVELRVMELQPTEFENAAFVVFSILLVRALLASDANLYMPLSLVDENMRRAGVRDAALRSKFFFPSDILRKSVTLSSDSDSDKNEEAESEEPPVGSGIAEMTLDEIINGTDNGPTPFIGLIPLIRKYCLDSAPPMEGTLNHDSDGAAEAWRPKMGEYLYLIARRARGEDETPAARYRKFIRSHPSYRHDSVIQPDITYDLIEYIIASASRSA